MHWWIVLLFALLGLVLAVALFLILYFRLAPRIGGNPQGARLARIQALPNYRDGKLHNRFPTNMNMPFTTMLKVIWTMARGSEGREPRQVIPTVPFDHAAWDRTQDFALVWFGHSTLLIKID